MIGAITAGLFGTGVAASTTAYESISTVTVGAGGTGSISFSSIPITYKNLQIRVLAQTNRGTYGIDEAKITFNSDSGANYAYHTLYGDGSSATSGALTSSNYMLSGSGNFGTTTGSNWGSCVTDILDYANTSKYKTLRSLGGADANGTVGGIGGRVSLVSGLWQNTAAISTITLVPANGSSFSQYSSFALYGIKG
jgi:hypothetical protein